MDGRAVTDIKLLAQALAAVAVIGMCWTAAMSGRVSEGVAIGLMFITTAAFTLSALPRADDE